MVRRDCPSRACVVRSKSDHPSFLTDDMRFLRRYDMALAVRDPVPVGATGGLDAAQINEARRHGG